MQSKRFSATLSRGNRGVVLAPLVGVFLLGCSRAPKRVVLLADSSRSEVAPPDRGKYPDIHPLLAAQQGGELTLEQAKALVDKTLQAQLVAIYQTLEPQRFPAGLMAYRLGRIALHKGERALAVKWWRRVASDSALFALASKELASMREKSVSVKERRIAVLLPLSGRYRSLGREARVAVTMAAKIASPIEFEWLDTQGDAQVAVTAVEQAFARGAQAILGPLGTEESTAAAKRAAELGIPVLALSPRLAADPSAWIWSAMSGPEWEAIWAARYAADRGFYKLAVFYPRDSSGERQATAFARSAANAGAELVLSLAYDPSGGSLEADVKALLGLDPLKNPRFRRYFQRYGAKAYKLYSPRLDFDAIYIPDGYQRAALIASFLPYFNVEVRTGEFMDVEHLRRKHRGSLPSSVQLMGSSGWHHPGLFAHGGGAVLGALVIDVFAGSSSELALTPGAADFVAAFSRQFGRNPSALAAQAYDAALLVAQALNSAITRGRQGFARSLASAQLADGACGPSRMAASGTLVRRPALLRVLTDQFELAD